MSMSILGLNSMATTSSVSLGEINDFKKTDDCETKKTNLTRTHKRTIGRMNRRTDGLTDGERQKDKRDGG